MTNISDLIAMDHATEEDDEFRSVVNELPEQYWAKYDLSAVRLSWELRKRFSEQFERDRVHLEIDTPVYVDDPAVGNFEGVLKDITDGDECIVFCEMTGNHYIVGKEFIEPA